MYKYYFRYLISILYLWMLLRFSYKDIWILERSILFLLDFTNPPQPITSPELAIVESKMDITNITKNVQICFIVVDLASFDKIDKIRNPVSEKMWQTNTSVASASSLACLLMINKGSNLDRSYLHILHFNYLIKFLWKYLHTTKFWIFFFHRLFNLFSASSILHPYLICWDWLLNKSKCPN